ncbi:hypothetical protein CSA56_01540 [candidate division KSB3 bacterium]|uniref:CheW-like domain-containing protein n=1 Tax=candidate division KSB3 bacterium TaxID=2044937 RepID=A0A2G6KK80_9BACT|nr:MAG: hypothetical protein CSA56_01540 [candidate division KSB3 bacterium]
MENIGIIKFQLAGTQFGVFADQILEIVRLEDVRKIPSPLPYVIGLTEIRQHIIVIVDLRKRFGLSPIPLERGTTMIAMKIASGMVGLLVESISHFRPISPEQLLPPISIAGLPAKLLHGVVEDADDILILPHFDDILSSYIHLHLVPISSSEKIAFQYRSTKGAITRILENTLTSEGSLDETIIRKLPRAMELSSVYVHKVTSYYPHFHPQANVSSQEIRQSQAVRAGDETYFLLSKRLRDRREETKGSEEHLPVSFTTQTETGRAVQPCSHRRGSSTPEETSHPNESVVFSTLSCLPIAPQELLAQPEIGKQYAKTLRISPASLTKFLTYYGQRLPPTCPSRRRTLPMGSTSFQPMSPSLLPLQERVEHFEHAHIPLEDVLRMLNDARSVITRCDAAWLAVHYKVPLIKIAKLCQYFPHILFKSDERPAEELLPKDTHCTNARREQHTALPAEQHHEDNQFFTAHMPGLTSALGDVSRGFQYLRTYKKLSDDRAIRYVAEQFRILTCRLSKMRSYYGKGSEI